MPRKNTRALWTEWAQSGKTRTSSVPRPGNRVPPGRACFSGTILGIDPSLRGSGFAVVKVESSAAMQLLYSETLTIKPAISFPECLGRISEKVASLLESYPVDHVALEQTIYVQNFQTAQILGAARGAAIAPAARAGKPVFEYPPLRVKQAVVGRGRASKDQVAGILRHILSMDESLGLDESDATAVAACHAFTYRAES